MKNLKRTALAAACVGTMLFVGSASAADVSTLTVNGSVPAMCEFASPNYVINFGTLDPTSSVPAVSGTNLTYRCTKGTYAQYVRIDGGPGTSPRPVTLHSGTNSMAATLNWALPLTPGGGFGAVAPISAPVTATIAAADLNSAVAGVYTGTYMMLIQP